MEKAINAYLKYLKNVKHYSDNTISSYRFDLLDFSKYLKENDLDYKDLIDKDVQGYINSLKKDNYSVNSLNRKIVVFRNFYKYLVIEFDENIKNPMINYQTIKTHKRLPKDLFEQQVKALLVITEKNPILAIRNQCIILLLLNTGMRVSELCSLDLIDIDLQETTIRVIGKGNKERSVFFMPSVLPYLNAYLTEAREKLLKENKSDAFFIGSKGGRITSRAIEYILNDRASKANPPFKVTPHMLRHTFATNLLNNEVDLKIVQELLGHSSLSTTQIYTHVSKARLKKVYEETHPIAKTLKNKTKEE